MRNRHGQNLIKKLEIFSEDLNPRESKLRFLILRTKTLGKKMSKWNINLCSRIWVFLESNSF